MRNATAWLEDLESALERFRFSDLVRSGDASPLGATLLPRFADWLPYSAYLDAEKLFVNRDVIGFCLELHPQTGADEDMARVLTALYAAAPTGTGIQCHLFASPAIRPTLQHYARLRTADDLVPEFDSRGREGRHTNVHRTLARRRVGHLLSGARQSLFGTQSYLLRNYRLVITVVIPWTRLDAAEFESAQLLRESMQATLKAAHFSASSWQADKLINWVSQLLDPHRLYGDGAALTYDDGRELRDQMIDPATRLHITPTGIVASNPQSADAVAIRLLSLRALPPRYALWNMGSLIGDLYQSVLQYPCPFMISLGVHVLDTQSNRHWAALKSTRATTNASSPMARFLPELQEKKADWDLVLRALDAGEQLVDLYHQVTLFAPPKEITRAEQAARAIFRARGFELTPDTMMMTQALLASLPMTLSPPFHADLKRMKRITTKTTANAVHLAPLIAEWHGTKTPTLLFGGRRGQLMGLDVFNNDGGNYNVAIAGTSGSGKSMLLNEIAAAYLGTGARVWIIDVGRSYEKACRNVGGTFIEFTERNALSLNPFSGVVDIDEDMELLEPLLAQMVSPSDKLDEFSKKTLGHAIRKVWAVKGETMTVSDVHDLLATGRLDVHDDLEDRRLKDLAAMLYPFTRDGTYGKYFDGPASIDFDADFVVLELEELKAKRDLQTVVLLITMYRITHEMYFSRDRRKLVIIDEAWDLLSGTHTAEFIAAGYRRARKYNGAFMSATQSIDDYLRNPAAAAALNNSDWMFLLRQKPETIESLGELGQLKMDDGMKRLLQSLRTEQGAYSEVYIRAPNTNGIGRLIVDPFTLLLFSSRAEDFNAISAKRAMGLSVSDSIEAVLADRSLA